MFPDISAVFIVIIAGLSISFIPGPSMMYVLSRSISQNIVAAFISSLGLAIGGIIHAILAAIGVSAVIKNIPIAMTGIKFIGAAYLVYIGIKTILEKNIKTTDLHVINNKREPYNRILLQGIAVELFNPKTIIFFLAFLPQFVDKNSQHYGIQMLLLGVLIPLTAIPSDMLVTFTGGVMAKKMAKNGAFQRALKFIAGGILIYLAIKLIYS